MRLTENFWLSEFRSKDGADFPDEVVENLQLLANNLQVIRNEIRQKIKISSGYRSPEHNKKIKGAKRSLHIFGKAADLKAQFLSPKELHDVIKKLMDEGKIVKGGLKAYNTFVHYDIRGTYVTWK